MKRRIGAIDRDEVIQWYSIAATIGLGMLVVLLTVAFFTRASVAFWPQPVIRAEAGDSRVYGVAAMRSAERLWIDDGRTSVELDPSRWEIDTPIDAVLLVASASGRGGTLDLYGELAGAGRRRNDISGSTVDTMLSCETLDGEFVNVRMETQSASQAERRFLGTALNEESRERERAERADIERASRKAFVGRVEEQFGPGALDCADAWIEAIVEENAAEARDARARLRKFAFIDSSFEAEVERSAQLRRRQQSATVLSEPGFVLDTGSGRLFVPFRSTVRVEFTNQQGVFGRFQLFLERVIDFFRRGHRFGGIREALAVLLQLVLGVLAVSTPLGFLIAVHLSEPTANRSLRRGIRVAVRSLSGVPGVVLGVIALVIVRAIGQVEGGPSLMTLAIAVVSLSSIPVVVTSTERAFRAVPMTLRDASRASGALPYQTLFRTVVPVSWDALLAAVLLAVSRTVATVSPFLIFGAEETGRGASVGSGPFPHLGVRLYASWQTNPDGEIVAGIALVLFVFTLVLQLSAALLQNRQRGRMRAFDRPPPEEHREIKSGATAFGIRYGESTSDAHEDSGVDPSAKERP